MKTVLVQLSEDRWFRGILREGAPSSLYVRVEVTEPGTVGETVGRSVLCSRERIREDDTPQWVSFHVLLPREEMAIMDKALRGQGFREDAWCEYSRPDGASVIYGPCEPPRA